MGVRETIWVDLGVAPGMFAWSLGEEPIFVNAIIKDRDVGRDHRNDDARVHAPLANLAGGDQRSRKINERDRCVECN